MGRQTRGSVHVVDEDSFVFPSGWRRLVVPRWGGAAFAAPRADESAIAGADGLARAALPEAQVTSDRHRNDPELIDAGQEYLDSPGDGSALGAAVLGVLAACGMGWRDTRRMRWFADAWVARRGAAFAAEAVVRAAGLDTGGYWGHGGNPRRGIVRRTGGGGWGLFAHWLELASRVRAHLAAASDSEYAAAIAALEPLRGQALEYSAAASFLLPTERAWVERDCVALANNGNHYLVGMLWYSITTEEQVQLLAPHIYTWWLVHETSALATAVEAVGPRIAPWLFAWADSTQLDSAGQQRVLGILAQFPTEEALGGLIDRIDRKHVQAAVLDAAQRFPRRALRMLAATESPAAAEALRVHVLANRDLVDELLDSLGPAARARVERIAAGRSTIAEAAPESLPALLVTPPWVGRRPAARLRVVEGLAAPDAPALAWALGEQDEWSAKAAQRMRWRRLETPIDVAVERHRAGRLDAHHEVSLMLTGPAELIGPLLRDWRPGRTWDTDEWLPALIARYEVGALPLALRMAREQPTTCAGWLLPFASAEVVEFMADALARLKSLRGLALSWFDRHAAFAARGLVPGAAGKPGAARRAAGDALRMLAAAHRDEVLTAADGYGTEARVAVDELLDADPLDRFPTRMPALPAWADPALLPRILLADRSAVLGDDAARHLCTMLAFSKPGDVYAGVPLVRDRCDRRSLAEFGWALFNQWQAIGAPSRQAWAFQAQRWLGDDETVRKLAQVIRAWPGEGGHSKAVAGLDILAEIGTDLALMHLHGIAQKVKFKALKERAGQKVAEVAASLGLSTDQLADRLVPDLGLDADGSMTLEYGPRRFVVGFDEQLRPYVADEQGTRRKALPKPGVHDDQVLATEAYQRFSGLKKDVRTIASDQVRRLETAMVARRRWTPSEFRQLLVAHPLLWHIVRRLVWSAQVDGGEPVGFRVAEDRTFADVNDEAYELPESASVGVAHPLTLGESTQDWLSVLADYEISQPFTQLGRSVYRLTAEERAATSLTRFSDAKVATTALLGLERRGWRRGDPQDAGIQCWFWRSTPDGRAIMADLDPGIPVGFVDEFPEQRICDVRLTRDADSGWGPRTADLALGTLDEVTASELLRDLTEVTTR